MTRRSRLRLRAEPRSTDGGGNVADSDISKAAVRWNKPSSQLASNGRASARPSARERSQPPISLVFSRVLGRAGGAQPAPGPWPAPRLPIKNAVFQPVCALQTFIYICQCVMSEQIVCNIDLGLRTAFYRAANASRPALRRRARARRHGRDLGRGVQVAVPALGKGRGKIELVEHAGDDVIDN